MSDARGDSGNHPFLNLRPLPHFASSHHRFAVGPALGVSSQSPVNRPIANQSSWEYARASPPLPVSLPLVLCGRVDLRGCRIARIGSRRNLMSADNKALVRHPYEELSKKRRLEVGYEII